MLVVEEEEFKKGDFIIQKDTPGDKFYIIVSGNVSIAGIKDIEDKVYGTFEYFGEASLLFNTPRTADVIAATNVAAYSIKKESFLRLISNTGVEEEIRQVATVRNGVTWKVIKSNIFFKNLSSSQVTQLESIMTPAIAKNGTIIIKQGSVMDFTCILIEGDVDVIQDNKVIKRRKNGEFIGYVLNMKEGKLSEKSYKAVSDVKLYKINKEDFLGFLDDNPGVLMEMMFKRKS